MSLAPTVVLQEPAGLGTRSHANAFSTFSSDGSRIVSIFPFLTADHEGELVVSDTISGNIVTQWSLPRSGMGINMAELCSSADGRVVGYYKYSDFIALDTRAKRELLRVPPNLGLRSASATSPDATQLATSVEALSDGIAIVDLATGERVATLDVREPLGEGVANLQFAPDSKILIVHFYSNQPMQVWDLTEKKRIARLWGHTRPTSQAVFSADGSRMVSTGKHCHDLRVWDTESWQEVHCLRQSHWAWRDGGLAFTKDSWFLWSRSDAKSATLWNLQSGIPERQVQLSLPKMPTQQTDDTTAKMMKSVDMS